MAIIIKSKLTLLSLESKNLKNTAFKYSWSGSGKGEWRPDSIPAPLAATDTSVLGIRICTLELLLETVGEVAEDVGDEPSAPRESLLTSSFKAWYIWCPISYQLPLIVQNLVKKLPC